MKNGLLRNGLLGLIIATGLFAPQLAKADLAMDLQNFYFNQDPEIPLRTSSSLITNGDTTEYLAGNTEATIQAVTLGETSDPATSREATVDVHLGLSLSNAAQYANLSLFFYSVNASNHNVSVGLNLRYDDVAKQTVAEWFGRSSPEGVAGTYTTTQPAASVDGSLKITYNTDTQFATAYFKEAGDEAWSKILDVDLTANVNDSWNVDDFGLGAQFGFALVASSNTTTVSSAQATYANAVVPEPETIGLMLLGSFCLLLATQRKKEPKLS